MGNVNLGVGFVTKIWRVAWEDASPSDAAAAAAAATAAATATGASTTAAESAHPWCDAMARCDAGGKRHHWIVIRHYEAGGKVAVIVDGAFAGSGTASFSSCELKFRVGERVASVRVGFNDKGSTFSYSFAANLLLPDGSSLPLKELNETLVADHDPTLLAVRVASCNVERVPGSVAVALYCVETSVRGSPAVVVRRRFAEFANIDRHVRSAFAGSHLLSSLPALPPKQLKAFADHLSDAFIERRRAALDVYVTKLLRLPRANCNPDVLDFLGVLPATAVSHASATDDTHEDVL